MNADERRSNALRDLERQAKLLGDEIDELKRKMRRNEGMSLKLAELYAAEIRPLLIKRETDLEEVERLITELRTAPVQLLLF